MRDENEGRKGAEGPVGRVQLFWGLGWTCKNRVACDGMMCLFLASVTCVGGCHKLGQICPNLFPTPARVRGLIHPSQHGMH